MSIKPFYAGWDQYNRQIVTVVEDMSDEQLATRPAPEGWPVWATVGHTAGMRVYWLCGVLGESGADTTPFPGAVTGVGWEDDLDHPRSSAELVDAMESTWRILARCLDTWTPEMLDETFTRPSGTRAYTRQSVLMRLLTHEAYHCGELSQTLGIHGLTQIDLWPPTS